METPTSTSLVKQEDSQYRRLLALRREKFCKLYTSNDFDLFGNGTLCYLEIYGKEHIKKYKKPMKVAVAAAQASRLLRSAKVIKRINQLLEDDGLNDVNVDKQLLFLINQQADLKTKVAAIKEYNALKRRIEAPPVQVNILNVTANEQIDSIIERAYARRKGTDSPPAIEGGANLVPNADKPEVPTELAPRSDSQGVGGDRKEW